MRHRKSKILMAALTGALALTVISGCGTGTDAASSDGIRFWYDDDSYTEFFELAAERYTKQTGIKVTAKYIDSTDYIGEIYDETIQDESFPDVYLLQADTLAEAYLYGLVAVNDGDFADGTAEHAKEASSYSDTVYGYPLSFNTCIFVYQDGFFEEAPTTLESIITYSQENDPPEDVEYLLEWDVNDPFYDFPFIGNSVTFIHDTAFDVRVVYDEELYARDLEYFEEILESFSVDADSVSEDSIVSYFKSGHTLCAIMDTDMLSQLGDLEYSLMDIPDLSDELTSVTCASTDLIAVNGFTESTDAAADFARFITVDMASEMLGLTGHYSVISSDYLDGDGASETEQIIREAYENAVLMPDARDAKDFWVDLEETILKYF